MNEAKPPVFSVIIPAYNRASTLPRAIQSVLAQTFAQFELIVVDDGSTDDTAQVVQGFADPRLRYIHQANHGRSAARNAGATVSGGEYITFLDSDDEVLPSWLEQLWRLLQQPKRGVAFCGVLERVESTAISKETAILPAPGGTLFGQQPVLYLAGAFALRRNLFITLGGYAEQLTYSENTELGIRVSEFCAKHGILTASVDQPLVIYHMPNAPRRYDREAQISHLRSSEYMLSRHRQLLSQTPRIHALYLSNAGVRAMRVGQYAQARAYFAQAMRADPKNLRHCARFGLSVVPRLGNIYWSRHGEPTDETA